MKNEPDKIEVHKIEIKIGDKTISLKPEQAKELKKILNEMFEESKVVHHHHDYYRYWWNYSQYTNVYPQWGVTLTSGASASYQGSLQNTCSSNTVSLALNAA